MTLNNEQLKIKILEYWEKCAYANGETDRLINDLIYNYAMDCGIDEMKLQGDINLTIISMTASQKRNLYDKLLQSKIIEMV